MSTSSDQGSISRGREKQLGPSRQASLARRAGAWAGIALALSAAMPASLGCGGGSFNEQRDQAFARAVEASLEDDDAVGAGASFAYTREATVDDERYDRALMILAQSLEHLGLTYAASLWYLDVAQSRRNVELLDKAVAGLERIVTKGPHDHETLVTGYLGTAEISGLTTDRRAFVDYLHGLDSARHGLDTWADRQFDRIPDSSPYFLQAKYARAVRHLARRELDPGKTALEALLENEHLTHELRVDTLLALARLALEQQRYQDALVRYEEVRRLEPDMPGLLLEMAWANFYLGDSRRALGLLIALDAPQYQSLIAPERFLLEAFCLRRICQFEPARTAAARLRDRHGDALRDLHAGVEPFESTPVRRAARRRAGPDSVTRFLHLLHVERERLDDLEGSLGDALYRALVARYDFAIRDAERRERAELAPQLEKVATELLEAEDGVRLILHELSVDLLRGRRRPPGPVEAPAVDVSTGGNRVSYEFQGEFWTDELDDLVVVTPDRCLE